MDDQIKLHQILMNKKHDLFNFYFNDIIFIHIQYLFFSSYLDINSNTNILTNELFAFALRNWVTVGLFLLISDWLIVGNSQSKDRKAN